MSRLEKDMAPLCTVFDMDFIHLEKEDKLGVTTDLSRNVDFVLVDPPDNVHSDSSDDFLKHDVIH